MSQIDPGTSSWLRTRNDREALRLFLEHGALTRTRLGELSGMSKPTATQMIARLDRAGILRPVGEIAGSRGPSAVSYGVRTDAITGVAVSMLDDTIQSVLVDAAGIEHPIAEFGVDGSGRSPEGDIRRAIDAACAAASIGADTVEVIAVGVQAAVGREDDVLSLTDSLPGWPAHGSRQRLEGALGMTVTLENDVNLATLAERAGGVARDAGSFALLWLGVGLGVGVDLGGSIHRGAHGSAGEVGYLAVAQRSGAVAAVTTELLGSDAVLSLLGRSENARYADDVHLLGGDERALRTVAERIAVALEPVLAVLDPAMVVLGGPTSLAGGQALAQLVAVHIDSEERPSPRILLSSTGDSSVLAGARQLLVQQIRDRLEQRIPSQ